MANPEIRMQRYCSRIFGIFLSSVECLCICKLKTAIKGAYLSNAD